VLHSIASDNTAVRKGRQALLATLGIRVEAARTRPQIAITGRLHWEIRQARSRCLCTVHRDARKILSTMRQYRSS